MQFLQYALVKRDVFLHQVFQIGDRNNPGGSGQTFSFCEGFVVSYFVIFGFR